MMDTKSQIDEMIRGVEREIERLNIRLQTMKEVRETIVVSTTAPKGFTPELLDEMLNMIREGKKINAIKLHREVTGYGLKDSKDEVERISAFIIPKAAV